MPTSQENEKVMDQFIGKPLDVFSNVASIISLLRQEQNVREVLPYTLGFLMLLSGANNPIGYPPGCAVIGTDLKRYMEVFKNVTPLEVDSSMKLQTGQRGLYLSEFMRDMYFKFNGTLYYPQKAAYKNQSLTQRNTPSKERKPPHQA